VKITSPQLTDPETVPGKYTCTGAGVSPPLYISGLPDDARSLAVVMADLDGAK
jgi:hypothetical protein